MVFQRAFNVDALFRKLIERPSLYAASTATSVDTKWIDGLLHFTAYTQVTIAHFIAWVDKYIIDGLVNGVARFSGMVGSFTRSFQGGKIQLYIFWAMAGVIIFLFFVLT
jgi:NADH-quinone oxidoreductase subunit L